MAEVSSYQVPEMGRVRNIHFIGIGGAGMCGIAEVLLNQGYQVSGSDLRASETTRRLETMGAQIKLGHNADNLDRSDVVVVSSAIADDNPELLAAQFEIPILVEGLKPVLLAVFILLAHPRRVAKLLEGKHAVAVLIEFTKCHSRTPASRPRLYPATCWTRLTTRPCRPKLPAAERSRSSRIPTQARRH